MKYELIESFFTDLGEYMKFLLKLAEAKRATSDFSCIATLKKEDDGFLYTLEWKDGRWVGEYVRPFRATEENLELFNVGCAEVARRFRIYLETDDAEKVPISPPAFGILSCDSPDELTPPPAVFARSQQDQKYFPFVETARTVKIYDGETHMFTLVTDVKDRGIIKCTHLLIAFKKGEKEPACVAAAEVNNLRSPGDGSGSHFLGYYPGNGHINFGCSDDWGNLAMFEKEALKVIGRELDVKIDDLMVIEV